MSDPIKPTVKSKGRGRRGVKTKWGERNAAFCEARKAMRAGNRAKAEEFTKTMAAIQPLSKREESAIERAGQ